MENTSKKKLQKQQQFQKEQQQAAMKRANAEETGEDLPPVPATRTVPTQKAAPIEPTIIAVCRTTLRSNLMEKKFIATGKDFDSAVQAALKELGLEIEQVSVQLLERAKMVCLALAPSL